MKVLRAKLLLILATYILMACSAVGPEYSPPKPPIPKAWSSSSEGLFDSGKEPLDNWWNLFNDPILSKLIGNVIADNRDVRKAVARIEEARAQLGYVTGTLYPSIDASGSVTRGKQSESVNPQARVKTDYRTTIGASWEIDLFGRIRRSTEAAKANLDAANEDYRGVLISACAETARNYFLLRSTQDQLRAVEKNMESQREILEIVKARFEAGLVSELDVAQAEWALTLSQARIPPLK
ncbi:MAG: TolC family protein, partial [Syntrophobacterales bacterium]|nr:TolC family protein [Syntrophobacterales bacterium]